MPVQPTTKTQANGQIINKKRATNNAAALSTSPPHANQQQKSLTTSAAVVKVSNNNIRDGRNNSNTTTITTSNISNSGRQSPRQSTNSITPNVVNGNNNVYAQNGSIKLRDNTDIDDDEEFATIEEALNSAPPRKPVTNVAPQRHVGKLLRTAPLTATPSTQQQNALASHVQYDDNYASDFDAYDDDFEEEFVEDDLGRTASSTSALAAESTPVLERTKLPTNSRETDKTKNHVEKNEISDSVALPKVDVLLLHDDVNIVSERQNDAIDFRSAAQHSQQHARVVARRAAKFDTIRQLVQFDYAHHRHFTLTPAGTHARYLELFGKQNVKLAASQTADERREQEMQTEQPERANAWTQHPALSANLVSDREDFYYSTNSTTLNRQATTKPPVLMPSSSSIVQFIAQASDCIVKLLNESHTGNKHQTSSNVWLSLDGKSDIFASVSLIGPSEPHITSSIDYSSVLCMACSEPKMDRIATCHPSLPGYQQQQQQHHSQPAALTANMAVVLVWNAALPFTPEAILYTQDPNSRIVCCIFHKLDPYIIIAGCSDGSLVCWSIRTTTCWRHNAVQMSLGAATTKLIPLFLPEFSSAPLAGHSPPHVASIVALDEFIDKNGGHRVGIYSGVSSSCTLASLDACAALCLWNVVTNSNNTSDSAFSGLTTRAAPVSAGQSKTAEAIGIGEFCLSPTSLSTVLENKRVNFVAVKLTVMSILQLIEERLTSFASQFAGDHSSNLIDFDGKNNCMIRFSPFYSNGAILACLFDGRLYRVNSNSRQQQQKATDCTPRNKNGLCANIVSFAFPPSASSTTTTTLYQRHIVACLHDVGSLMFLSLESGQLLTTWSSPLMGVGVAAAAVAHSIWWPNNGAIIVVGTDATVVRFQFQSDDIIDSCWPVVTTDASMSSRKNSGDRTMQNNSKCVVSSYGSSEAMKLAILTTSGPITLLKIR